uniref:Reverse transcriptase zinc-binding domain-containing protein n=1 Tax=Lactuca sativa TaxID=4236 RepID=A0A9R1XKX8_LACSA|nr:hypothetical protein LSAT_V11C300153720 [Lactuca sativa]
MGYGGCSSSVVHESFRDLLASSFYELLHFVAPMGVISTLERIRRKFLWGEMENNKKINWVTWEKVIEHKEAGGLGLGSLRALNLSLIAKWWWRLRVNQGKLWSQVIQGIHKIKAKEESCLANRSSTGVWKNIASIDTELRKVDVPMEVIMKKKVNKGDKTLWIGNETLKVAFPNLYALEKKKRCTVEDRVKATGFERNWKTTPNINDLTAICSSLGQFRPTTDEDKWRCVLTGDEPHVKIEWIKEVPIKVLCFIWRASLGRIPAATELSKRGVMFESVQCGQCMEEDESPDHILLTCPYAMSIWEWFWRWCNMPPFQFNTVADLIGYVSQQGSHRKNKKVLISICYGTLWEIWKARNGRLFKRLPSTPPKVANNIQSVVYMWLKYRSSAKIFGIIQCGQRFDFDLELSFVKVFLKKKYIVYYKLIDLNSRLSTFRSNIFCLTLCAFHTYKKCHI